MQAGHGARGGARCRVWQARPPLALCHLFLEAKTEGYDNGEPWRQSGVGARRDYAREEFKQSIVETCTTVAVLVGMHDSELAALQAGERGEWAAVRNPIGVGPETMCSICSLFGTHKELRGRHMQATGRARIDDTGIAPAGAIRGGADDDWGEILLDGEGEVIADMPSGANGNGGAPLGT